ncbi:MAG: M15 family metallopeptidase [Candidatus Moranbacteria bacterium]|nr:M15 family metallopeptidase [Candidatus Moranbacteria bacterium]
MEKEIKKISSGKISPVFKFDLERGMRNEDVRRLQCLLNSDPDTRLAQTGPGSPGYETNYYGSVTQDAVTRFQLKHGVIGARNDSGSGRTGPKTRVAIKKVFSGTVPAEKSLITQFEDLESPPPYNRCFDVYGDFRVAGWKKHNIVRCDLSKFHSDIEHIVLGWSLRDKAFIHRNWIGFLCHKLLVPKFQDAFQNVVDRKLADKIKTFDGCLNERPIRGGKNPSTHSWGVAIDLNAKWNPMGKKEFEMDRDLAKCFEDAGFIWGGRWQGRYTDAMHFQYVS